MKHSLNIYLELLKRGREKRRRAISILLVLSFVVAGAVSWNLRLNGVTATVEAFCGYEEHTHGEKCALEEVLGCDGTEGHVHSVADCFAFESVLSCVNEEHVHGEDCYNAEGESVCSKTVHTHSDACYTKEAVLVCEIAEGEHVHTETCYKEKWSCGLVEHVHEAKCFADTEADVETAEVWESTLPELSGYWAEDTASIAISQIGYAESDVNFILGDNGEKKYYSRYGEWFGNKYGDWNVIFAEFCLYYAGVTDDYIPMSAGANSWQIKLESQPYYFTNETKAEAYVPSVGSVLFIDLNTDGAADKVAVLTGVSDGFYNTVEGDLNGVVGETMYALDSELVIGFLDTTLVAAAYGEGAVSEEVLAEDSVQTFLSGFSSDTKVNFKYMSYLEKYDFIKDDIEGTYILSGIIDTTAENNDGSPKLPNNKDARDGKLKTLALPLRQVRTAGFFTNNDIGVTSGDNTAENFYFYELGTKIELDELYNGTDDVHLWSGTSVSTNDKLGVNDSYDLTAIWVQKTKDLKLDSASATTDATSKNWKDWTVYCLDEYYQETDVQISLVNVAEGKPVKVESVDGSAFSSVTYLTVAASEDVLQPVTSVTSCIDKYGVLTNGFSSIDFERERYGGDVDSQLNFSNGAFDLFSVCGGDTIGNRLGDTQVYFTVDLIDVYDSISQFTIDAANSMSSLLKSSETNEYAKAIIEMYEGFELVKVQVSENGQNWTDAECYQDNVGEEEFKRDRINSRYSYTFVTEQRARYIRFQVADPNYHDTLGGVSLGEIKVYSTEIDRVNYALNTAKFSIKSAGISTRQRIDYKGTATNTTVLTSQQGGSVERASMIDAPYLFDNYTALNTAHSDMHDYLKKDRYFNATVTDSNGATIEVDLTQEAKNINEVVIYSANPINNYGGITVQSTGAWDANTNLMSAASASRMKSHSATVTERVLWDGVATRYVYFIDFTTPISSAAILRINFGADNKNIKFSEIKVYGDHSNELNYALGRYVYLYNTGSVSSGFTGDSTQANTNYSGANFGIRYNDSYFKNNVAGASEAFIAAHTFHTTNYTLTNGLNRYYDSEGNSIVDTDGKNDYVIVNHDSNGGTKEIIGADGNKVVCCEAVDVFDGAFNKNRMVFVVDLDGKKNGITKVKLVVQRVDKGDKYDTEFNIRSVQAGMDTDGNYKRGWINGTTQSTYPALLKNLEWTEVANGQLSIENVGGSWYELTYTFTSTEAEYIKIEGYSDARILVSEIEVIGSPWVNAAANKSVDISFTSSAKVAARKAEGTTWMPDKKSSTEYAVAGADVTDYIRGLGADSIKTSNFYDDKKGNGTGATKIIDGSLASCGYINSAGETLMAFDLGRTVNDLGQVVAFVRTAQVTAGNISGFEVAVATDESAWSNLNDESAWTNLEFNLKSEDNTYDPGSARTKFTMLFDNLVTARYLLLKVEAKDTDSNTVSGTDTDGNKPVLIADVQAFGGEDSLKAFDLSKNVLTDGNVPLFGLDDTLLITGVAAKSSEVTLQLDLGQVRNVAQVEVYTGDDDNNPGSGMNLSNLGDFSYKEVEVSVDGYNWVNALILQEGSEPFGGSYTNYGANIKNACYVTRQYAVLGEDYEARYIRITGVIDDKTGYSATDFRCMLQEVKVNCIPIYENNIAGYYNGREGHVIPVATINDLKSIEFTSDSTEFVYEDGSTVNVMPKLDSNGKVDKVYVGNDYTIIYIYTPLSGTFTTEGDMYDYRISTYTWNTDYNSPDNSKHTLSSLGVSSGALVPLSNTKLSPLFLQTAFNTPNGWRGIYGINANYNYFTTTDGTTFAQASNSNYTVATKEGAAAANGTNSKARIHFGNENNSIGDNGTQSGLSWLKWNDGGTTVLPNLSNSKLLPNGKADYVYQQGAYGIAASTLSYKNPDGEYQINYNPAFDSIDLFNGMYGMTPLELAVKRSPESAPYGRVMGKIAYDYEMEYVRNGDKLTLSKVTGIDQFSNGKYAGLTGGSNGEASGSEKLHYLAYVYYKQDADTFAAMPTNNLFPLDDVYFVDRIFERKDIGDKKDADKVYIQHTFGQTASTTNTNIIATERNTGNERVDSLYANRNNYGTFYEKQEKVVGGQTTIAFYITNNTKGVNIRSSNSSNSTLVATIPNNTVIVAYNKSGDWAQVSYDGKSGYANVGTNCTKLSDDYTVAGSFDIVSCGSDASLRDSPNGTWAGNLSIGQQFLRLGTTGGYYHAIILHYGDKSIRSGYLCYDNSDGNGKKTYTTHGTVTVSNTGTTTVSTYHSSNMVESDDFFAHNHFFGMHDEIKFTIPEDYCGPLEFFFYGDDDMWVYLDGQLICDIGGVHQAIAEYVNLWDYIDTGSTYSTLARATGSEEHTLSIFYTERGAYGSTCYVSFTVPVASTAPRAIGVSKEAVRINNAVVEDVYDDEFSFRVSFYDVEENAINSIPADTTLSYFKTLVNGDVQEVNVTAVPFNVNLKSGENFIMQNLPDTYAYFSVEETGATGSRIKDPDGNYVDSDANHITYYTTDIEATGGLVNTETRTATLVPIDEYNLATARFTNIPAVSEMPETGGGGIMWFMLIGFALTVIPMGAGIFSTVKKAKRFLAK